MLLNNEDNKKEIKEFILFLKSKKIEYRENEPLSRHTSFGIGGNCLVMVFPNSIEEIFEMCYRLKLIRMAYYIIGNGTNLLVKDSGYDGVIIKLSNRFSKIKQEGNKIICQAGLSLFKLNRYLVEKKLSGLEFSYGIPGTVGGATIMNAGAFGGNIGDRIEKVYCLKDNKIKIINKSDLIFDYRYSNIDGIVLGTKFSKFITKNSEEIKKTCNQYMLKRKESQPYGEKSAGSVFKRQQNNFITSKEIDKLGLKGYNINGAEISTKHAGFIVNKGGAKCEDVLKVIDYIKEQVFEHYGRILELEIKIL